MLSFVCIQLLTDSVHYIPACSYEAEESNLISILVGGEGETRYLQIVCEVTSKKLLMGKWTEINFSDTLRLLAETEHF